MRNKLIVAFALVMALLCAARAGYVLGRPKPPKIRWYSQAFGSYVIDREVNCPNGKPLGRVQIDYDLTNGKWRTVRNDPGESPDCTRK